MKILLARLALCMALATSVGCASPPPSQGPNEPSRVEVAFSPEGGAEALVLRVIDSSHVSLRLAGYSFTSPSVVKSLMGAKRRGVDVKVLVDDRGNRGAASRAAIAL